MHAAYIQESNSSSVTTVKERHDKDKLSAHTPHQAPGREGCVTPVLSVPASSWSPHPPFMSSVSRALPNVATLRTTDLVASDFQSFPKRLFCEPPPSQIPKRLFDEVDFTQQDGAQHNLHHKNTKNSTQQNDQLTKHMTTKWP